MTAKPCVLVIEDDPSIAELIQFTLEDAGYRVIVAVTGDDGLRKAESEQPVLVLVDWMLPVVSGLGICRQLRDKEKTRPLPIIMLTARGEEHDRIHGLEAGADDYITKPFSPAELLARIRALLRRSSRSLEQAPTLTYETLVMNTTTHSVERAGEPVHLGPTEYRLLKHFLQHPQRVFSREQLLDTVWGGNLHVEERTVDVHIRRLRKAINPGGSHADIIRTVRAAGYSLDDR